MARYATLGNGNLLILMDKHGFVRDLYYPHAGLENHVVSQKHLIGISINRKFYWLSELDHKVIQSSKSLKSIAKYTHFDEGIEIKIDSLVYNEKNIFVRKVKINNKSNNEKEIKLFFHHEFKISENKFRNTAFYYPEKNVVIHYRGNRVFLVNIISTEGGIDDYTIGMFDFEGKKGSFVTAENIDLPKNPVEHGPVDSVIAKSTTLFAGESKKFYYCLIAGKSIKEVIALNHTLNLKPPKHIVASTNGFWRSFANQADYCFEGLSKKAVNLFYRSIFVIKTHTDKKSGGVIASGDSSHYEFGKDNYAYVWPRDMYFPAKVFLDLGYTNTTRKALEFFGKVIDVKGFLMHKFQQDFSLGSSWHPWINNGEYELPIQEDETACVVNLLFAYFEKTKDVEFLENNFENLVERPANFMCTFINKNLMLPQPSYDLWEAKYLISTYSTCATIRALLNASVLAQKLGKNDLSARFKKHGLLLKTGLEKFLFNKDANYFINGIYTDHLGLVKEIDKTVDSSSLFALWYYNIIDFKNEKFIQTENAIINKLKREENLFIRFDNDDYFRDAGHDSNPWIITSLWIVMLKIQKAENKEQMIDVSKDIEKIVTLTTTSGVLPEQVFLRDKKETGYCPLIWSHATYLETINMYIKKLEILGICKKNL
ncbi:glycoside hydrolase family 15 protein [Patescibacteria group bacterium]|nr:glycoside hydrolase family 15 protein [Patescibacteria group bacterium]